MRLLTIIGGDIVLIIKSFLLLLILNYLLHCIVIIASQLGEALPHTSITYLTRTYD